MKVKLRANRSDGKIINIVMSKNNIQVSKSYIGCDCELYYIIEIEDDNKLNSILLELNEKTDYAVDICQKVKGITFIKKKFHFGSDGCYSIELGLVIYEKYR